MRNVWNVAFYNPVLDPTSMTSRAQALRPDPWSSGDDDGVRVGGRPTQRVGRAGGSETVAIRASRSHRAGAG